MKRPLLALSLALLLALSPVAGQARAVSQHVVLISVDGLAASDLDRAASLPNFGHIIGTGAVAREVRPVYPSLTYPSHTSIITGTSPAKHGITANTPLQPGVRDPEWYFWARDIRVQTLYSAARKAGIRTACVLWPVTARASIDYLLPEIWPTKPGQSVTSLVLANGSPLTILALNLRFGKMLRGTETDALDDFTAASAAYVIRTRRPGLLMVHLTDLDHQKHEFGSTSPQASEALARQDARIGTILDAVRKAGITDSTTFVVMGDHGFLDTDHQINLNALFVQEGLMTLANDGTVTSWDAAVNPCDGSAHVYVKDDAARLRVMELLSDLETRGAETGVESVDRSADFGPDGPAFVVEARRGYYFGGDVSGELVVPARVRATHGYSPAKPEMATVFMATGAGIRPGSVVSSIDMTDVAPTLARLMGVSLPDTEGRVIEEILVMPE
ncbi:MAG: ectonucleotide pyrophosphatase/phosphodiesterase [Firmicutes bacterium]|nr:ectonucleotide pyrophosphatase/phosphodiesterase [Bacillota bacterium]